MSVISTEPKASGEIRSLRMEITDFSTSLCSARNDIKKTQQLHKPEFDDIISKTRSRSPPASPAGFCLRSDSNVHFYAFAEFCGGMAF